MALVVKVSDAEARRPSLLLRTHEKAGTAADICKPTTSEADLRAATL